MADDEELLDEDEDGELNIAAIVIAAVLILALIGGGVWFFALREPPEESAEAQLPGWEPPPDVEKELVIDLLPQLIINPRDSRGRYWLVVKVDFAVNNSDARDAVIGEPWRIPQAKNIIIDIFSDYTLDELRTPRIREEARQQIKEELNALLGWEGGFVEEDGEEILPPIKEVYFVEYMMQ